jgi:hypothetical protein
MPTRPPEPKSVAFDTTLTAIGNNTGIIVPPLLIDELGAGRRPAVVVEVNGYQYRNSVGVMDGQSMISVSAAVRSATGLKAGDAIRVTLTIADSPRPIAIPPDLEEAFKANEAARAFFVTLSNSLQRCHILNITGAKTAETRQRRIDKAIGILVARKQR